MDQGKVFDDEVLIGRKGSSRKEACVSIQKRQL